MRTLSTAALTEFGVRLFVSYGASPEDARTVAASLVQASLLGHDSHGILRFARYAEKIDRQQLDPSHRPEVIQQHGAVALVDGHYGFGQVSAALGTKTVIGLARTHGVGAVALSHTNHIGRLGEYAGQISAAGLIGLVFSSGAGPGGSVAAFGGRERIFGTNPLAWGLPVPAGRGPLVADFSTSAVPEGKIGMAQTHGEKLPPGVLIDKEGRATVDPAAFYAGGAILPFGGHKGYSLVLLIELMASLLAGSVPSSSAEYQVGNPTLLLALSVEAFGSKEEYLRHTGDLLARIERSAPAEGFDRVLLPNTLEIDTERRRQREGIPVPDPLWVELAALAKRQGVALPD